MKEPKISITLHDENGEITKDYNQVKYVKTVELLTKSEIMERYPNHFKNMINGQSPNT